MLPAPLTRPSWLALRCLALGGLISGAWMLVQGYSAGDVAHLLVGTIEVGMPARSAWAEMLPRCARTLFLVGVAMSTSACVGFGLALLAGRVSFRFLTLAGLLGQCVAALPVMGIAWAAVGWVVDEAGMPVESLLPYAPPPERDTQLMFIGRECWAWLVPAWALATWLSGWWLAYAADAMQLTHAACCDVAFGGAADRPAWGHWQATAWKLLRDRWIALTGVALAGAIVVEDVFGLRGWGAFAISVLRRGAADADIATAVLAACIMVAVWAMIGHLVSPLSRPDERMLARMLAAAERQSDRGWQTALNAWLQGVVMLIVLILARSAGYSGAGWISGVMLPVLDPVLPAGWSGEFARLFPGLLNDLQMAGRLGCIALAWILAGTAIVVIAREKLSGRMFGFIDSLAWCPLMVLALLLAWQDASWGGWLALAASVRGIQRLSAEVNRQRGSGYALAAVTLGGGAAQRWLRHLLPPLLRTLSSSMQETLGMLLLLVILARSLVPQAGIDSLGTSISLAGKGALIDLPAVIRPTLLAALPVLCFWRLSRLARPLP